MEDDTEWGLSKGMELFEVSAKDDFGETWFALSLYRKLILCFQEFDSFLTTLFLL